MRKRNIAYLFDNLMWFIIYLLPIFAYLFALKVDSSLDFASFLTSNFMSFNLGNSLFANFSDIFHLSYFFDMLDYGSTGFECYIFYFIVANFMHLVVDILLFLPRVCHNLISRFGGGKGEN